MNILYTWNPLVTMCIDKVEWITALNCGKPKMEFIHVKFKLKRENLRPRHRLTKCALENKLLIQNCWSWCHFSQEKLPHTLIPIIASSWCWKYAVPFFYGPPCIDVQSEIANNSLLKGNFQGSLFIPLLVETLLVHVSQI